MELFLIFWGTLAGTLALTLLIGRLTRQRLQVLRLFPLGLLLIPLTGSVVAWVRDHFLWQLEVALWAIIGSALFLGWLIGWAFCRERKGMP
ncbi:MAG: hypothetical protein MSB10_09235 [Clostridiales bacterium]|uniref:hypothetical protein n=1 Tax=Flavonifractor porci TaxID=3133422 RepID=UPI0030982282|nr:hypothetical protein [Clostridiales bacterium]